MDLLKKEMERKKKVLESAKAKSGRFIRVKDLREVEEEETQRTKRPAEPYMTETSKRSKTDDVAQNELSPQSQPLFPKQQSARHGVTDDMSSIDITTELRSYGLPIRLFGETDIERRERLQDARKMQKETLATLSEKEEFRLGKGHSIRNPFLEKNNNEDAIAAPAKPSEENKWTIDDETDPPKKIYRYLKGLLREWEDDLMQRPEEVKRSVAGRNETKTLKQCKDYIRPLFKLCKNRTLAEDMMGHILKIVEYCQQGEFVKANDTYIDVAIGRAAWPIGVTMVGIHERTGRSKINSQNVAHVMNSELQRKYLTSVKRLITFAQRKRPDVDPSKKVMN
ncbi:pre-mRNA-splicing factor 18 [Fistulifera solaris]|uniref:Pre-mRNA-splicing factor 18 n=1 Tax=Fistulifera solaris TaxID=1519565 RepID=A0A1Z5K2K9_FISSO|nr:pre-mRNA-splicing factor 18 [Fistulifera solaris]|eukprot:GAX20497.1 pre-mRNA-splicing factor 18 [Fistulifera solaris]